MTNGDSLGSTYRLQLNGLGFTGARALVPYLDELGVETLYLSPVFAAVPESTHGYDVIDPTRLDPALGSAEEYEALLEELAAHGMRALLDVVPNHMATDRSNRWWWETLREGQASTWAAMFDIDWSQHGGRVLVPVLGRPLGEACNEASVRRDPDGDLLELDGQRLPLAPGSDATAPLPDLLAAQHHRPAFWRLGDTAGNYRRFFDIDGLVGVRVEDPGVFSRTHELVFALCADERVAGLRIDHVDGLWDPAGYLARLGEAIGSRGRPAVVLVEKILGRHEALPRRWSVDGTTGYEFSDRAAGLFLDEEGCQRLCALGAALTGVAASFEELAHGAKRELLERTFVAQLDRVVQMAMAALDAGSPGHDLSTSDVRRAVAELTIRLDVYRTYLDGAAPRAADVATITRAGRGRSPDHEIERAVTLVAGGLVERARTGSPWLVVAQRWQQLTGAVMAKGVEDTATYRYDGLLSHADVGCDPDDAGCNPEDFHRFIQNRPRGRGGAGGLNSTSTHDSKRNEDARCRLAVLSEASEEWGRLVRRWHRRFASTPMPHPHDELVAYQTLVALWPTEGDGLSPADLRRVKDHVVKAAREAKQRTSWTDPDLRYERRLTSSVARMCHDESFRGEMVGFVHGVGPAAATNSMALLVLKACAPGVPDFYQGTELFEATVTDPDNRRPVDFAARHRLLMSLPALGSAPSELGPQVAHMLGGWESGQIKLYLARALLHLRRHLPRLFSEGSYLPLEVRGPRAGNVVAFARRGGREWVIVLVPRLTLRAAGRGRFPVGRRIWTTETCLLPNGAPTSYADIFTGTEVTARGGRIDVVSALHTLPVAVLRVRETSVRAASRARAARTRR